ncbi:PepSY-associated TM helix domain-containing protein [Luteimonas panaciterrae]|uniref:PepSY-associated TM helix domain-containing protein n=1 Tax=Luteimonas panaciterrae TaxID=363885 RepID=UPI001CFBA732|nr:PepSY-associated TM helix domain-containing protein [Luteimonas panaciterrae]
MKNSFSQSMAWLHTWAGLVVGWMLFVIFVGGTIACFDTELDRWMRPGMAAEAPARPAVDKLVAELEKTDPEAHAWYLYLPRARFPAMKAGAYHDDGRFEIHAYDAATGAKLRDTAGGEFFFTLHYNLHAGTIGMYLVGLAGMMMLVAILTGIVIHKRIFKDFFLFRFRGGGQRAWLDGHNITGVLGLPFHLMIAYTGVAIFVASYMTAGLQAGYRGDAEKFYKEAAPYTHREEMHRPPPLRAPLQPMIDDARKRLGADPWIIAIEHPNDASTVVNVALDHSRHVAWNYRSVYYDGITGAYMAGGQQPSGGYHTYTFLGGLHMVQFGGMLFRWLYFLLGLSGCVMLACGMQVWVEKRARRVREAGVVSGYGLVRALNIGAVAGMPLAVVSMLWANRLLPDGIAERATQEIRIFCAAWIVSALWACLRLRRGNPWRELFFVTALLCLGLPLLSMAVAPEGSLLHTVPAGAWAVASVDWVLLAFGAAFAWLARRASRVEDKQPDILRSRAEASA